MIENSHKKSLFRSICTHRIALTAFRSMGTRFYSRLLYFCVLISIDNKLTHNYMAGKITEMSKLK